jgi:glycosyltransferase involved in cell wall biosynthesis
MTPKKNNILIIAGGPSRYVTVSKHINKLIRIFTSLSQKVYLLSAFDEKLIDLKNTELYQFQTSENRYIQFSIGQIRELSLMYTIFKTKKIDIVFFAFGHDHDLIPILFSKLMGKKIILRSDGRPSVVIEKYHKNQSALKKCLFRIIEYINYRSVDLLVSECNFMLKENNQDQLPNCGFANLPVDLKFFIRKTPFENRKYDLGYIGSLEERKGIVNFIKAIAGIIKNNQNLVVFIGGKGEQKEAINQIILENNLEKNIRIIEWISDEAFPDCLNSFKVFVLPSSREGLPNTILEAMACGTIVLSTPVGGVPGVVIDGKTGFIMKNNSVPCITENIVRALNHPDLAMIADNAYNLIEHEYSFNSTLQRYREILENI